MAWKKFKLLSTGSYGSVYLAGPINNSFLMGSVMAVKSADMSFSTPLQMEANLLQELRGCRYIIQGVGTDVSTEDGREVYNLLLEYASGGTLDQMIKAYNGAMAESQIATYTYMLLKGLASIHDKEIVHCDIKPTNILVFPVPSLSEIYLLKIADFGFSKKVSEGDVSSKIRCTPGYASPETVLFGLNEKVGDIWALGCVVVEMITGKPLWNRTRDLQGLFRQIAYENPRIPENVSDDAKDFLKRCLDRDHSKRWNAKMLLDHPFIVKNLELSSDGTHQEVVFSNKPWTCSRDMFSTPLMAQSDDLYKAYQLFPKEGCRHPFGLPFGAEVISLF